ncbi:MAG: hypothetical protein ACAI44_02910 [Candidatus Sericytochromatia bacterium]
MRKRQFSLILATASLLFACSGSPGPTTGKPSPSPGQTASPSATPTANPAPATGFAYLGLDADKVMSGAEVKPDGKKDLHFVYTHTFAKETTVKSILVFVSKDGVSVANAGWNTQPGGFWVLGVDANGASLLSKQVPDLNKKFSGTVRFDMYGSQAGAEGFGLTKSGTEYTIHITPVAQAGTVSETIKVTAKIP